MRSTIVRMLPFWMLVVNARKLCIGYSMSIKGKCNFSWINSLNGSAISWRCNCMTVVTLLMLASSASSKMIMFTGFEAKVLHKSLATFNGSPGNQRVHTLSQLRKRMHYHMHPKTTGCLAIFVLGVGVHGGLTL